MVAKREGERGSNDVSWPSFEKNFVKKRYPAWVRLRCQAEF